MRDLSQFTAQTFTAHVAAQLANPQAALVAPSTDLTDRLTPQQLQAFLQSHTPHKTSLLDGLVALAPAFLPGAPTLNLAAGVIGLKANRAMVQHKRAALLHLAGNLSFVRPILSLTEQERALLRAMAALVADNLVTPDAWTHFHARLCYGKGDAVRLDPILPTTHKHLNDARVLIGALLQQTLPPYPAFLAESAQSITVLATTPGASIAAGGVLSDGARWMKLADVTEASALTTKRTNSSLLLGTLEGRDIYFNGHESLLTVGGAGSGKSQGLVIPNLLLNPGSAIVLDVKGELWNLTAAHRAKHFGPVYRFSPLDPDGRSHRFNPFDFVSRAPQQAAVDCEVFTNQIIIPNPKLQDPYWENKGRDFTWAFATMLALTASKPFRTLDRLSELASLPLTEPAASFDDAPSLLPDAESLINLMIKLGHTHDIPDLIQAANALKSGAGGQRLESVLDAARRYLSIFARSKSLRAATSASDWHPTDLRRKPGTTIYIVIPDTDLKTYAPIVRLMFFQHVRLLKPQLARPDEAPITFFLDEMPQLGNFQSILTLQDTGRGAGLRLWMFAQTVGQILDAYGKERGEGLIGGSRIRTYLQPDQQTADTLSKAFGQTRQLFTGDKKPLASVDELMGRPFADQVIVQARSDYPARLQRQMAYATLSHLMTQPPPQVPRLPR